MCVGLRIAVLAGLLVTVRTPPARGDAKADAARLFEEGRTLAKEERFSEACGKFAESYKLEKAVGTALNLADCFERQAQLEDAWRLFDAAARDPQAGAARVKFARDRMDTLGAKLATVIVTIHDPSVEGMTVKIGDREEAPAREIREVVEPSEIDVTVSVPEVPAFHKNVHGTAGSVTSVDVPAMGVAKRKPPPPPPPPPRGDEQVTRRQRSRVYIAGGLGAAGVVALGVALGVALDAKSTYDSAFMHGCTKTSTGNICSDPAGKRLIDDAGGEADIATGLTVAGVLLAGAAVAVFVTAPQETITVHPVVTAHEVGVGLTARF